MHLPENNPSGPHETKRIRNLVNISNFLSSECKKASPKWKRDGIMSSISSERSLRPRKRSMQNEFGMAQKARSVCTNSGQRRGTAEGRLKSLSKTIRSAKLDRLRAYAFVWGFLCCEQKLPGWTEGYFSRYGTLENLPNLLRKGESSPTLGGALSIFKISACVPTSFFA